MSNPLFVNATFMPPQAAVLADARAAEAQPPTSSAIALSASECSNASTTIVDPEKNMTDTPKPARRCEPWKLKFLRIFLWLLLILIFIALVAIWIKHRLAMNGESEPVEHWLFIG